VAAGNVVSALPPPLLHEATSTGTTHHAARLITRSDHSRMIATLLRWGTRRCRGGGHAAHRDLGP